MVLPTHTRAAYHPKAKQGYQGLIFKDVKLASLKPSEVLVKVHAVSLNFRDLTIPQGLYPAPIVDNLIPCSDMAGEVLSVGDEVSEWKVGDRVSANFALEHLHGDVTSKTRASELGVAYTDGVLTQYRVFKEHSLVAVPEHLFYEEASTLPCAALTAYSALMDPVPVKAGDTVLILGTGGVSIFALQFAVASAANVIVTSSSDEKLELAKKFGARHTINYSKTPEWHTEVLKLTKDRGVDYAIEVGGPGTLAKSIQATRHSGYVSIIGAVAGMGAESDSTMSIILSAVVKQLNLRGIHVGSVERFRDMNRLIASHPDTTRPLIDSVFAFEDTLKAFEHLESQKHVGKVVIKLA
ncbi:hypothetical protein V5O48_008129 [Marasmius crinis-equi]|uniref:Enoyl reductase (ER) domain-containing protein n=1 Tax=Marasmius crinis-equi TaxID=585013 RepID=A0ABR3FER1_9AGAR